MYWKNKSIDKMRKIWEPSNTGQRKKKKSVMVFFIKYLLILADQQKSRNKLMLCMGKNKGKI